MNADGWNATTDDRTEYYKIEEVLRVLPRNNFLQALVLWDGHLLPTWEPLPFIYHTDAYKIYKKKVANVRNICQNLMIKFFNLFIFLF